MKINSILLVLILFVTHLTVQSQENKYQDQYFKNLNKRADLKKQKLSTEEYKPEKVSPTLIPFSPQTDDSNFVEIYYQDFETGLNGWTIENLNNPTGPAYWHASNVRGKDSEYSAASNDSTTGFYTNNYFEALVSPPIELPEDGSFILVEFDFFMDLPQNPVTFDADFWYAEISSDGGATWNPVTYYYYYGSFDFWYSFPSVLGGLEDGDITEYAGETVNFRFVVKDFPDEIQGEGLFIDNFAISVFTCEGTDPYEPNDEINSAFSISYGDSVKGASICPATDVDYFTFDATEGDFIKLVIDSPVQIGLSVFSPNSGQVFYNFWTNEITFFAHTTGQYVIQINAFHFNLSSPYSFYLQKLNPNPDILFVEDIPEDQGNQVRVVWKPVFFDMPDINQHIYNYNLWREVDTNLSTNAFKVLPMEQFYSETESKLNGTVYFSLEGLLYDYIETIPSVPNRPFVEYSYVAPTLYNNIPATFLVAAVPVGGFQYPTLWGVPGVGVSTDDITPAIEGFQVNPLADGIQLEWQVNSTVHKDLQKFNIFRSTESGFTPTQMNLISSLRHDQRSHLDMNISAGVNYFYKIQVFDESNNHSMSPEGSALITSVENNLGTPNDFALEQNYPNPFNPSTTIKFALPNESDVSLKVYDIIGNEVAVLVDENMGSGFYEVNFNASNLASGIYFYRLNAGDYTTLKKMILIK